MSDNTEANIDYLKKNIFSISTFIMLIGFFVQGAKWQENMELRVHALEVHALDKEMHMPFKDKIEMFVPRVEIDGKLDNIEKTLSEIKSDIKKSLNQ